MKSFVRILSVLPAAVSFLFVCGVASAAAEGPADAASGVVRRIFGPTAVADVSFVAREVGREGEHDAYDFTAANGSLTVTGGTPVALARGYYDYLKSAGIGQFGWSGARFERPARWPDAAATHGASPVKYRYDFNVVTYGYTMPYWTWARWERELDWMALHGINLPLALVANEAISERVWKSIGLTQPEIDAAVVGPAHLPWYRMGNIAGHDGPLPASWHKDQIALQHQILGRMKQLGITPVTPAFAGFVPAGIRRLLPDAELHRTAWAFPAEKQATFLSPNDPAFNRIGRLFITEWEKEFGKSSYFLSDSFNEMELPKNGKSPAEQLTGYGQAIYRSIADADPDATWVIQGWMFGYQRKIWTPENLAALLSKVPDDKMLLLDLAADYNATHWHNGMNYDFHRGFYNKPWVYSVIPNMGGKTMFTGVWDFYAKGFATANDSPNRGRLIGAGAAGEGIENNELIHELCYDAAWSSKPVDLATWLPSYAKARYGAAPTGVLEAWDIYRRTCNAGLNDHPSFNWQVLRRQGTIKPFPEFHEAAEKFLSAAPELKKEKTYQADAIEVAALSLGMRADEWFRIAYDAQDERAYDLRDTAVANGLRHLATLDRLLESHPVYRLERWTSFARAHGENDARKDAYESNARRLVTTWGPPINDYSCRMWSGLVRDFYAPRIREQFEALKAGREFVRAPWEEKWVQAHGVSRVEPFADPVQAAASAIAALRAEKLPAAVPTNGDVIATWDTPQMSKDGAWVTLEVPVTLDKVRHSRGIRFLYKSGYHRLDMRSVTLVADGKEVAKDAHNGTAGLDHKGAIYKLSVPADATGNNSCTLKLEVRSDGGTDSRGVVLLLPE
ncbi:MAG: alpha-N-acetylglucosaminidase TIM-barrel domain-containing protein [Luteolibacter sp.]